MRNTEIREIISTVPAANATYDVDLPAGTYYLSIYVTSAVTGATTKVAIRALDHAGTAIDEDFKVVVAAGAAPASTIDLAAGADEIYAIVLPLGEDPVIVNPAPLAYGVQVGITKGGATTGEAMKVTLVATRIG
jgi:hypothetical protein